MKFKTPTPSDIKYHIVRSRRRSVAIMVKDGLVEVRAPKATPNYWIDDFVRQKKSWIEKQLIEQSQKAQQVYRIENGQQITYLGAVKTIRVVQGNNRVHLCDDDLLISSRTNQPELLIKLFDRWLLQQAKEFLPTKVELLALELKLDNRLTQVKFRKTKTKWGHCTIDGVIQLNQLIMLAPMFVIDYLIVHELCHLGYMNHSKDFWALVAEHCPAYQDAEIWIKQHGHQLWYIA